MTLLLSSLFFNIFWILLWCNVAVFSLSNSLIWISINEVRFWVHEAFHFCLILSVFKEDSNSAILEVILNNCDTSFFDFLLIFLLFFLCFCLCSNYEREFELISAISVFIAWFFSFQSRYLFQSSSASLLYDEKLVETLSLIEWFLEICIILNA